MLGQADIRWATVQVSIAELLRDAGNDGDVQDRAEAVVREAEVGGLSSSIAYARFALCFHAVITGEVSLIATARSQLQRCVRGAEFAYLLELSYFMTGSEPPITCIGPSGSMAGNEPLTDGQDLSSDAVGISLRRGDNAVMASYTTLADVDQPLIAGRYGLDELHLAPLEGEWPIPASWRRRHRGSMC